MITDHLTPGRWDAARPMRSSEVAATLVLALPLVEFSVKSRDGGPNDDEDAQWPIWAGHVPVRMVAGAPIPAPGSEPRTRSRRSLAACKDPPSDGPALGLVVVGQPRRGPGPAGAPGRRPRRRRGHRRCRVHRALDRLLPGEGRARDPHRDRRGERGRVRRQRAQRRLVLGTVPRIPGQDRARQLACRRPSRCSTRCTTPSTRSAGSPAPRGWTSTGPRAAPSAWPGRRCSSTGRARTSRTGAPGASAPRTTACSTPTRRAQRAGATAVLGATYTPHCAAIHPAKLARGLAALVEAAGVRIYEGTPATSIEPGVVRTPFGDVRAAHVVRATEAFTATLPGHRARPAAGLLADARHRAAARRCLGPDRPGRSGETFNDGRHLIIYGQRTADDRLAFGGRGRRTTSARGSTRATERGGSLHEGLWQTLTELFPAVGAVPGDPPLGRPAGHLPRLVRLLRARPRAPGSAWAGGYVGDGVGTANLAGRTLADLLTGRDSDLTELPWVNHRSRRWEPEPLRWLGANGGLAVMTSADASEAQVRPARAPRCGVRAVPRPLRIPPAPVPRIESGPRQDHDGSRGHHRC